MSEHPIRRTYWNCPSLDVDGDFEAKFNGSAYREEANAQNANLVGSRIKGTQELHAPALDIDFPARLVESTTPGHFHLYLDKPLTWPVYERLLRALGDAGIIEPGYMDASIARGQTFVRKPGVAKPAEAPKS